MRVETVLNHCYRHKSFIYSDCRWGRIGSKKALIVDVLARKNGLTECSICGKVAPLYDCLDERRFDFVPLWNIPVYFQYWMRRVKCPEHGVRVERVPWAKGKSHLTKPYVLFLSRWARKLSWKETAESFGTTWDNVYRSVLASHKFSRLSDSSQRSASRLINSMFRIVISSTMASNLL